MRTNRLLLFVIIGITLFGNNAFSQCYIELENHSGLDISFNQSEYNELACEIIDSLPVEFQNDFKVFSFGNYLENRDEGILETNTSNRLAYIQTLSSYYLAFEIIVSPS